MYRYLKRLLDILASITGVIILSPIFVIIFVVLFIINKGKPLFFQERPGKSGKIFKIIKFKTMTDGKDENGELLPIHLRLTKFGIFLRKFSLDEIPQLFNVIFGTMSLIGPRPLLIQYLPLYNDFQKQRHDVKPGITGWAQVNGRNVISWDKKFGFDVWYVNNISLIVDIKILFLTIKKVLISKDVNSDKNLNMPDFTGSDNK